LRLKEVRQAYVAVCGFLDRCTSVREAPKGGSLTIHERGRFSPPNYHHEPFVAAATAAFGSGDRQLGVQMFPDTGYTEYKHEWRIPSTGIERAIDLVATCPRSGPEDVPPMSFSLAWRFRLRDPRTGEALPSIGGVLAPFIPNNVSLGWVRPELSFRTPRCPVPRVPAPTPPTSPHPASKIEIPSPHAYGRRHVLCAT